MSTFAHYGGPFSPEAAPGCESPSQPTGAPARRTDWLSSLTVSRVECSAAEAAD